MAMYEGDVVTYTGTAMPPAQGQIMSAADGRGVHVLWRTGAREGQIDLVDAYDLAKVESPAKLAALDPMSTTAVRRSMDSGGPEGVLTFLATAGHLETWPTLAQDLLADVKSRLRKDASMSAVWDQLDRDEVDEVVHTAAVVLIRDAFSHEAAATVTDELSDSDIIGETL